MFIFLCTVLNNIIDEGGTYAQNGEAYNVSKILLSFKFVFTLHLMITTAISRYFKCNASCFYIKITSSTIKRWWMMQFD